MASLGVRLAPIVLGQSLEQSRPISKTGIDPRTAAIPALVLAL
jgi:hypothetical protein